jgi:hypothetical protein
MVAVFAGERRRVEKYAFNIRQVDAMIKAKADAPALIDTDAPLPLSPTR